MNTLKLTAGLVICMSGLNFLWARSAAQETSARPPAVVTDELLRRIEQLEARIAELERRSQPVINAPVQPTRPAPQTLPPPHTPIPGTGVLPEAGPALPQPLPVPPAAETGPADYWHKGMINGRPFYIIPLGQQQTVTR